MHPNFREFSDERVDAAVLQALAEVDLPQSYRISIRSLVRSRAANWRSCCGGNCNPCIGRVEEAVDLARRILLSTPVPSEETVSAPVLFADHDGERAHRSDTAKPGAEKPAELPSSNVELEERNWGMDYA